MMNRAGRPIATLLSLLLITSTTVKAGPISISEVVQIINGSQVTGRGFDLHLRNVSQGRKSPVDESVTKSEAASHGSSGQTASSQVPDASSAPPATDSLLSGIALSNDDPQGKIDVISQGDLEGSICDCGEIPLVEGHGFPKLPLVFLAVIPLFFIHHHHDSTCETCDTTTTPTPTPNTVPSPPGVPEPASWLLMGSGLVALANSLRRRHARSRQTEIASTEEA